MRKYSIIALLAAVVVFFVGYRLITGAEPENGERVGPVAGAVTVVVAARDIEPYTVLTPAMLRTRELVINETVTGYYETVAEVAGSFCTSKIFSGEILTENRISESTEPMGLSMQLGEGMRAITLAVDIEQGVGNNIKVGNYVDLIFTTTLVGVEVNGNDVPAGMAFLEIFGGPGPENAQVLYETIDSDFSVITLQNVKVVALDKVYTSDLMTESANIDYASVTLEVTPEEAAQIALMDYEGNGTIQLILRPQHDNSEVHNPIGSILQPYPEEDEGETEEEGVGAAGPGAAGQGAAGQGAAGQREGGNNSAIG